MKQIRVIAPQGASIRGPAVLALTADQAKRRTGVLTPAKAKGRYNLAEGVSAMFKHGEELGIDGVGRLNLQLFQDIEAEAKAKAESDAEAEGAAKGDVGSGSLPLGAGDGASE